ncbi:MAG: hypothetical protein QOF56_3695 [Acidobacteriaceae bacterium]|jgi:hypothetical protein|nr:hypothetical protein [Acidobacteriaceae bacterium]
MRKKGENSVKCAGKSAIPPDRIMISPLISKVNLPIFLTSLPFARLFCGGRYSIRFTMLRDSHQPAQRLPLPRMRLASARYRELGSWCFAEERAHRVHPWCSEDREPQET